MYHLCFGVVNLFKSSVALVYLLPISYVFSPIYRPCVIALPPPDAILCFSQKYNPLFEDFTNIIFYTKILKHKRKIAKFFWGGAPDPHKSLSIFPQGHQYCIFASFFLVLIDQKSTKRHRNSRNFSRESHFQNPHAIFCENFRDDCYVNRKGTTPIQDFRKMASGGGELLHKDGNLK